VQFGPSAPCPSSSARQSSSFTSRRSWVRLLPRAPFSTSLPRRPTVGRPVVTRWMGVQVLPRQPPRSSSGGQSATLPWSRSRVRVPPASPSASWAPASPAGRNPVALRAVQVQLLRRGLRSASSDGQSAGMTRRRPAVRLRRRAPPRPARLRGVAAISPLCRRGDRGFESRRRRHSPFGYQLGREAFTLQEPGQHRHGPPAPPSPRRLEARMSGSHPGDTGASPVEATISSVRAWRRR
jgi:hypothetical protein